MKIVWTMLLLTIGCQKESDTGDVVDTSVPPDCTLSANYCVSFSSDWSQTKAQDWCAEREGAQSGDCPPTTVGDCDLGDGSIIHMYDIFPVEGEAYCDYLAGEWVELGAE
ncbi:MAG: hypothetical protein CL930_14275 [Deltaproteobacteria bacterium]|nr:hypothetical protein [Deltaproteobacteria bacterium]|tara:strand:- start:189 stop:518 length:330 start_codon:yes stop_codon:yes gene_type:complete